MALLSKILSHGILWVGLLPTLAFSFGTPTNTASYNDVGLNLVQQARAEHQQLVIAGQALHILNSSFDIEESTEENLNDNFNTTFTSNKNQDYYSVLRSVLNTRSGKPLHLVRYYILYCCPKIPSFQS